MEIEIISEKKNQLLKRREVTFLINHKMKSTPSRLEAIKLLAKKVKSNENLVYIKKIHTKAGSHIAKGASNIYESVEHAKLIEPQYIISRNSLKEHKDGKE